MRSRLVVICSIAIVGVMAAPAAGATTLVKVIGGPEQQFFPFVNDTYVVWTQNSEARPGRYNAYADELAALGNRVKLNEKGTRGYTGGLDPGTNRAIYQQADGDRSTLYWFNLDTKARTKVAGVNTRKGWEWAPRVSTSHILFQRDDLRGHSTMLLYDRTDGSVMALKTTDYNRAFMIAGAVGEQYASWTICAASCNAFIYEIATDITRKLALPKGKHQYAPVVDEDRGSVYFTRSGNGCGVNVRIMRRPVDDLSAPAETIVSLPDNKDTGWTIALHVDVANARVDGWFEYYHCGSRQGDIWEAQELDVLA